MAQAFRILNWVGLSYFLALNSVYLVLILVAAFNLGEYFRSKPFAGLEESLKSPLTLPVSVLMPAHNEEAVIVHSARAILALRYPQFELIIVDDGSSDQTFERLNDVFNLVEIPMTVPRLVPTRGEVRSVHVSQTLYDLTVIRKASIGQKTDALNAAINVAKYPLLCMVDADAVLDEDALIKVTMPFVDNPQNVVATGGAIRPSNGCEVVRGRVTKVGMPSNRLAKIQVAEYLRAFLLGRTGWSRLHALLIISGAFGVFRRDCVINVGGYNHASIGEDADLVARIHRYHTERKLPYEVTFVSEPVCWTEVPEDRAALKKQRQRWARGLADVLWTQRRMFLNPRYGNLGLLAFPYFVLFEVLGPAVELTGFITLIIAIAFHFVNLYFAGLFLVVAIFYGILISVLALLIEEFSYHRYESFRDIGAAVLASILENFGFRQLHALWRLEGTWQAFRRSDAIWGEMKRKGFEATLPDPATLGEN